MNKEEILQKSREEKTDEGFEYILNKSRRWYVIVNSILCIFYIFFNAYVGKEYFEIFSILFSGVAISLFYAYKFTGSKMYLFFSIFDGAISLMYLIIYVYKELSRLKH